MKPSTMEWIEKAEGDFATAQREYRVRRHPNYDAVCFHAQQCAEKYLKAQLQESGIPFVKTHDLVYLLGLLPASMLVLHGMNASLAFLSAAAVEFRYPGESALIETAKQSLAICKTVREEIRLTLALPR